MSKKSIETLDFANKKSLETLKNVKKRVCKLFFSKNICAIQKKVVILQRF